MIKLFENYNRIAKICKKYEIENWTINTDGSIDVVGDVDISNKNLTKLPLKFGRVGGYFDCENNNLATLEGAPMGVWGFCCSYNKLTTLEGAPRDVAGSFYCDNNNLTTLEGCPREVGGDFYCHNNKLTTLEGAPREVAAFWCNNNNLSTLLHAPREVAGGFYFHYNNFPEYLTRFMVLNKYSQPIIKQILKWQDEYELWKEPKNFEKKFKWMMEDIQENDLLHIKIKFPK